ncbi:laccase [Xylariales sp. PMI_506]|nr:laccase [Xylariales sp. PMI_506]
MLAKVALFFAALAAAAPTKDLGERASGTCNTATDRACWTGLYTINTDYETSTPSGTTVTYNWEVTEEFNWVGPDGQTKSYVQLVNGQFPGPTLHANWGDTVQVTITNNLASNGTAFHWHGIRQLHNNLQDGVNGVTECPLAPGKTKTYHFVAQQYGTTWYHSHHSGQYGDGVWGPIQIAGPASADYDVDLGPFPVGDYYYQTTTELTPILSAGGGPPPSSNNILFNGTNIYPADPTVGEYAVVTLTKGLKHRIRIINPSLDNHFQLSLVGHNFTVISTDLVPVEPVVTDNIFVGIGQRYDIIIDANQDIGSYWFNATLTGGCGTTDNPYPAAIFRYAGADDSLPTDPGTAPASANCADSIAWSPVISRSPDVVTVGTDDEFNITSPFQAPITWYIDASAIDVDWSVPVLDYVLDGNTSYPATENLYFVDEVDEWTYWVFNNQSPAPHPMHLHGHDFVVLGTSATVAGAGATYATADSAGLNFVNPTRRDVTMVPANGWLVVGFKSDNPGNWLFHCHIAWHVGEGLSLDFMERRSEQEALIPAADLAAYQQVCSDWRAYEATAGSEVQSDSGI